VPPIAGIRDQSRCHLSTLGAHQCHRLGEADLLRSGKIGCALEARWRRAKRDTGELGPYPLVIARLE
jgi:hypothetical protein